MDRSSLGRRTPPSLLPPFGGPTPKLPHQQPKPAATPFTRPPGLTNLGAADLDLVSEDAPLHLPHAQTSSLDAAPRKSDTAVVAKGGSSPFAAAVVGPPAQEAASTGIAPARSLPRVASLSPVPSAAPASLDDYDTTSSGSELATGAPAAQWLGPRGASRLDGNDDLKLTESTAVNSSSGGALHAATQQLQRLRTAPRLESSPLRAGGRGALSGA